MLFLVVAVVVAVVVVVVAAAVVVVVAVVAVVSVYSSGFTSDTVSVAMATVFCRDFQWLITSPSSCRCCCSSSLW